MKTGYSLLSIYLGRHRLGIHSAKQLSYIMILKKNWVFSSLDAQKAGLLFEFTLQMLLNCMIAFVSIF